MKRGAANPLDNLLLRPVLALEAAAASHYDPLPGRLVGFEMDKSLRSGLELFRMRNYQAAAESFRLARSGENRARALAWEGACGILLGNPAGATKTLLRWQSLGERWPWPQLWLGALELGLPGRAWEARVRLALSGSPAPALRVAAAFLEKVRCQRRGDFSEKRARRSLASASRLRPWGERAWAWRAELERDLGRRGRALSLLSHGIRLHPASALLRALRARLRGEGPAGRVDALCLADLDRAVELDASYAKAWAWRGEALRKLGRPTEARAALDRAIRLDPSYGLAYAFRSKLESSRPDAALKDLDRAIRLDPGALRPYAWRAELSAGRRA